MREYIVVVTTDFHLGHNIKSKKKFMQKIQKEIYAKQNTIKMRGVVRRVLMLSEIEELYDTFKYIILQLEQ